MITLLILYFFMARSLKRSLGGRKDGSPLLDYFTASSLGLEESRFSFWSRGHRLSGSRYWKKGKAPKRLLVFFHGLGAGRTSYLHLMARLAAAGYLVYAYDELGCMESGGSDIGGLGGPARTMPDFFAFLDQDPRADGLPRYSLGHSWGGYAAMISLRPEYHVKKAVSLAGFVSPSIAIASLSPDRRLARLRPLIKLYLLLHCGPHSDVGSLSIVKESSGQLLYLQGEDDQTVSFLSAGRLLQDQAASSPNITVVTYPKRGHQCYLTAQAEMEVQALFRASRSFKDMQALSYSLMGCSEEEPQVLQTIIDFLAK